MGPLVQVALVALGSAVGGVTRWGVGLAAARLLGKSFPWGTLAVNVSGCLLLGWFLAALRDRPLAPAWLGPDGLRLLVAVGLAGGYTTFSAFEAEARDLLRAGDGLAGVGYLLGSVLLGLVAVRAGELLARAF